MEKFKVGDKVRRIGGCHGGMALGDTAELIRVESNAIYLDKYPHGHDQDNFELVETKSLTPFKKTKMKYKIITITIFLLIIPLLLATNQTNNNFTIAVFNDLQNYRNITEVINYTINQKPNLILQAGDIFQEDNENHMIEINKSIQLLNQSGIPFIFARGNHDSYFYDEMFSYNPFYLFNFSNYSLGILIGSLDGRYNYQSITQNNSNYSFIYISHYEKYINDSNVFLHLRGSVYEHNIKIKEEINNKLFDCIFGEFGHHLDHTLEIENGSIIETTEADGYINFITFFPDEDRIEIKTYSPITNITYFSWTLNMSDFNVTHNFGFENWTKSSQVVNPPSVEKKSSGGGGSSYSSRDVNQEQYKNQTQELINKLLVEAKELNTKNVSYINISDIQMQQIIEVDESFIEWLRNLLKKIFSRG